jgi:multiple sugar transport system substrate-binding protein
MKISRRSIIKTLGASTAALTLSAPSLRKAFAQAGKLVYWGHNYTTRVRIVDQTMVPGFAAETGIQVQHENFETNQNELKILTAWSGGGGGPDLVSVGANNFANYVYRKLVAPVDFEAFGFASQQELIDSFEPGSLDGFIVDGTLYAMPMDLASISMFYRKDLFKEAGLDPEKPPQTWEEVTEMGKQLIRRDSNGTVVRAGWGWMARSMSSHFYYWGAMLPQKGVDFLNAEGTANGFNNEAGMEAFRYLHSTFHGENQISALGLAPTISPVDDFGAGRVAMLNAGLWLAPGVEQKYPNVTYKDGVYGVARLPQFKDGTPATRLNPWVYMVSAGSQVQKQAWQFVSYMTKRQESRDIWFKEANFVLPWKGFRNDEAVKALPYAQPFFEDLAIGKPLPNTHRFAELASAVAQAYDRISANGDLPETVVPELASAVDNIVAD